MIRDEKAESQQNGASGSSPEANQPATKGKAAAKLRPARGTRAGTKRKTKAPVSDDEENDEKKPVKKRTKKGKTSLKLEEDDEPVASQDDKDWGESAAQLEQHQPMTLFGPFPVPTANEDDDAEQPPRLEEDDSGEA